MANVTIVASELNISHDGRVHGWVSQPNTRGTFDILSYCLVTIFISTFTILCLNVPSPEETTWKILRRRLFWMAVAISGPEFVLTYASAQWGKARASVRDFKASNHHSWTMRHGFFADMGGFLLCPPDCKPFPVTSRHIHWLVTHGYLDMPKTTLSEIDDKSKQDTIAKLVSFCQNSYLILQCCGRFAQHLTITTIELSALAIVTCSILTSFCWWRKPVDVLTPIHIRLKGGITVQQVRREAGGRALIDWDYTPLDFIDDLRPSWALNVQKFMKMPVTPHDRPIPRLHNDRLPDKDTLNGYQKLMLCLGSLLYAAIHLCGWGYKFPTDTERVLWRASSMFLFGNTVAFWVCETTASFWRRGLWQRWFCKIFWRSKLPSLEEALQRVETSGEPRVLPLKFEFWSIFPLAWTYAAARVYMIVEAFASLREMDLTAYENVDWAVFIPHF